MMEGQEVAAGLDAAVRAVCPEIDGVSVPDPDNRSTWSIWFREAATTEQRAAGIQAMADYIPEV